MGLGIFSRIILRLISGSVEIDVPLYIIPGLMETELAVRIFRRASSLGVSPCSRYGVDSKKLGRAESSEIFSREGKAGLEGSSLFVEPFSCSNGE